MLAGCVAGEAETKILGQAGDDEGEEEPSRLTWFLLAGFEGKGEEGKERVFVVLDKSSLAENEGVRLVSDGVRLLCERGSQTADYTTEGLRQTL